MAGDQWTKPLLGLDLLRVDGGYALGEFAQHVAGVADHRIGMLAVAEAPGSVELLRD